MSTKALKPSRKHEKWRGENLFNVDLCVHVKITSVYDLTRNYYMLKPKHINKFIWCMLLWSLIMCLKSHKWLLM